eukprot:TRINITY_DN5590_c0_g1_i1.p3 TRINITY_DN5590_c0_g1~~TRINITY_DN5590_c0_g1_i1.p3  ORF type:complete len:110 (+),score=5.15 TRINITY_DN5590_c0_g1_i1:588-917(+)
MANKKRRKQLVRTQECVGLFLFFFSFPSFLFFVFPGLTEKNRCLAARQRRQDIKKMERERKKKPTTKRDKKRGQTGKKKNRRKEGKKKERTCTQRKKSAVPVLLRYCSS